MSNYDGYSTQQLIRVYCPICKEHYMIYGGTSTIQEGSERECSDCSTGKKRWMTE